MTCSLESCLPIAREINFFFLVPPPPPVFHVSHILSFNSKSKISKSNNLPAVFNMIESLPLSEAIVQHSSSFVVLYTSPILLRNYFVQKRIDRQKNQVRFKVVFLRLQFPVCLRTKEESQRSSY